MTTTGENVSPKSGLTAFILCMFFGIFGIHRFYVGKIGTGLLMLITFGGLGFWSFYDFVSIVCQNFKDKQDRYVIITRSPKAARNLLLAFLLFYVSLIGFIMVTAGAKLSAVKRVAKNELAVLRTNDIAKAYSLTSEDFKKSVSLEDFKKFIHAYPQFTTNTDSTFEDIKFQDNTGGIKGYLIMPDKTQVPMEMRLVNQDQHWQVESLDLTTSPVAKPDATPATVPNAQ